MDNWNDYIDNRRNENNNLIGTLRNEASQTTSAYKELREVRAMEEMDNLNKKMNDLDAFESAVAATPDGGSLSPAQLKRLNEMRGIQSDGKTIQNGQVIEGGYNPKTGGYGFVTAAVDSQGNVSYSPSEIPRTEIYGMMRNRTDLFSPEEINAFGASVQKYDPSITSTRLDEIGNKYAIGRKDIQGQISRAQENLNYARGGARGGGMTFDQRKELEEVKKRYEGKQFSDLRDSLLRMEYDGSYLDGKFVPGNRKKLTPDEEKDLASRKKYLDEMQWGAIGYKPSNIGGGNGGNSAADVAAKELETANAKAKHLGIVGKDVGAGDRKDYNQGVGTNVSGGKQDNGTSVPTNVTWEGGDGKPAKGDENEWGGNLRNDGRKVLFRRDKDGKINGYSTTSSMVAKLENGSYVVIPTVVDGIELSKEDAIKHYNKTKECWGVAKTEAGAKKMADSVHNTHMNSNQKDWNEYIYSHWDDISDEIRNNPDMKKEYENRHRGEEQLKKAKDAEEAFRMRGKI